MGYWDAPAAFFFVCHFMVKLHVQRLLESPDGWYTHSFLVNPFSLSNTSIFGCYAFVWWLLCLKQPWFSAKEHPSVDDFFYWTWDISIESTCCTWSKSICFLLNSQSFLLLSLDFGKSLTVHGCLTSHFHLAAEIESFGCVNLQVLLSQWYYIKHNIFLLNNSSSGWLYPHVYFLLNFSRLKSGRCLGCARENRLGCLWNHHLSCLNPLTFHMFNPMFFFLFGLCFQVISPLTTAWRLEWALVTDQARDGFDLTSEDWDLLSKNMGTQQNCEGLDALSLVPKVRQVAESWRDGGRFKLNTWDLKRISPDILYHLAVAILLFLWTSSFEAGNLPFLTLDDLAWCSRWRCLLPSDILALRREGLEEWREFMVLIRHGGKIMGNCEDRCSHCIKYILMGDFPACKVYCN